MKLLKPIIFIAIAALLQQCSYSQSNNSKTSDMDSIKKNNPIYSKTDTSKVTISESEWEKILPKDVYNIARQKGTERPWSSKYEALTDKGTYYCAACGNALFQSDTKFESGCGWPSFYQPISKTSVIYTA